MVKSLNNHSIHKRTLAGGIFLIVALAISIILYSCSSYGDKITYNNGKNITFYTSNITQAEAKKLGDYLVKIDYFSDNGTKKDVKLSKNNKSYLIKIPVEKGLEKDQETIQEWKDIAYDISDYVYDGRNVEVELCNDDFETLEVINID